MPIQVIIGWLAGWLAGWQVSDSLIRTLLVVPEGIPTESVLTRIIQSAEQDQGIDIAFPVNTTLPLNVVPDSASAQAQVTADLMTSTIQGLESLLTIPYGCGEQNMVRLKESAHT